jgi:elongation factor Ts
MITMDQVKELRDKTGVSVMQCKKALEEAGGNFEKALAILMEKGSEIALKKADRDLKSGLIASYVHGNGTIGVLVELLCETDFVARNKDFKECAEDIAMHIAAMNPKFLKESDITQDEREKIRILPDPGLFRRTASRGHVSPLPHKLTPRASPPVSHGASF